MTFIPTLSVQVRNWCACWECVSETNWAYASDPYTHSQEALQFSLLSNVHFVYPQQALKELMQKMSMRVRNWCVCCWMWVRNWYVGWAEESGTGACTEHMHQELMPSLSTVSSKHASGTDMCTEHTGQELKRTMSINISFLCIYSAEGKKIKIWKFSSKQAEHARK